MVLGWRTTSLLVILLVEGGAQSGDGDDDVGEEDEGEDRETRIRCSSHISTQGSSLTCKLLPHPDQDEEDSIQTMSLCYSDWAERRRTKCLKAVGDTIDSKDLDPVLELNLTVHLSRGGDVSTAVDLKKIVRPRSPEVWNVTFDQELSQVVVHIRTPYHNDFLNVDNQLFQLQISSSASNMIQNISSKDFLTIDMQHLQKYSPYEIRVRSIPYQFLQGTWSEWSPPYSYKPPRGEMAPQQFDYLQFDKLAKVLAGIVLPIVAAILLGKTKIFTCMWPRIPRPKETLVHICRTNKGVLLSLKPEVFSSLRVSPLERCEDTEPSTVPSSAVPSAPPSTSPSPPSVTLDSASLSIVPSATHTSSTLSSGCSSVDTETSTLLSSSCGEDSPPSTSLSYDLPLPPPSTRPSHILTPSPGDRRLGAGGQVEVLGQQEEAYVTMSSFSYQAELRDSTF